MTIPIYHDRRIKYTLWAQQQASFLTALISMTLESNSEIAVSAAAVPQFWAWVLMNCGGHLCLGAMDSAGYCVIDSLWISIYQDVEVCLNPAVFLVDS